MRVAVLPREIAASVITGAVSRMGWTFGAVCLWLDIPVVIETFVRSGRGQGAILPVILLLVQAGVLAAAAFRPHPLMVAAYLLIGAVCSTVFEVVVIRTLPDAVPEYVFLLNRPAVALTVVGVTAASTLVGVSWIVAGTAVALIAMSTASALAGVPLTTGIGPYLAPAMAVFAYTGFAVIQSRSRARVPNIDQLEAETQALADGVDLARRTTAVVHDTVLNDLAIVMNGPDRLDDRARTRLRADLQTLTDGAWLSAAREVRPPDDQDAHVRNAIAAITSDLQWRGLTVQLSGTSDGITRVPPEVMEGLLDGMRAALENVLRHSGATSAEVAIARDDTTVSVTVADEGAGFDLDGVDADRLGIRSSIVGRMEAAGGGARVWSTPGAGTSVVMWGPIERVVVPGTPSRHREEFPDA